MNEFLRQWLTHQLGIEFQSLSPDNLYSKFKNGVRFGQILQNYNILSPEQVALLVDEDDEATKLLNINRLRSWLGTVNVSLDDETIEQVLSGQNTAISGLLYRLCFHLESPDSLNLFFRAQQANTHLKKSESREREVFEKCIKRNSYQLQNDKLDDVKKAQGDYTATKTEFQVLCDEFEDFERSLPEKIIAWTHRGDQTCERYLTDLKACKKFSKIYNGWRKETINTFLKQNLDDQTSLNKNELRRKSMPDTVNLISDCEKRMLIKINNARYKKRSKKNDRKTSTLDNRVKFVDYGVRSLKPKEYCKVDDDTKLKIKKRLLDVNNEREKTNQTNAMKSIVLELMDFSIRGCEYRKKNAGNIPKHSWESWLEMFIKGRPLLVSLDDALGFLLDPKYVEDNKPYAEIELKTQHVLNRVDLKHYLEGTGIWSENVLDVKIRRPPDGDRVLGFLVFDVLSSLHGLPPPVVNMGSVMFGSTVGVINGNIGDIEKQQLMESLIKRSILPVLPEVALQYCMYSFYRETDSNELLALLELEDNDNTQNTIMQGESQNFTQSTLTEATSLSKELKINLSLPDTPQSKQTQTPYNENDKKYEKERAECGKYAFLSIYKGKTLPKHYLTDCILCYIKENQMVQGFVIIGYPNTPEEVMLLEERLANKNFPPQGLYSFMNEMELTVMVPFKAPDLGDKGRYRSSLTSFVKIVSLDIPSSDELNAMDKYYKSHELLTLLQKTDKNTVIDNDDIEFFCDILSGQPVDWSEHVQWINIAKSPVIEESDSTSSLSAQISTARSVPSHERTVKRNAFRRERLSGMSEFDFVDHIKSKMFSNSALFSSQMNEMSVVASALFDNHLQGDDGLVLGHIWKSLERLFIETIESCFFHRRILVSEQEPYVVIIKSILDELLSAQNMKKLELVRQLQSDLSRVPANIGNTSPDIMRQLMSAVSDVRVILTQLTNQKIEKSRQFIEKEIVDTWMGKQMSSIVTVYKCIIQAELDRTINTLIFVNAYMSKIFNYKLSASMLLKPIDMLQSDDRGPRTKQNTGVIEDLDKKLAETVRLASIKITNVFNTIAEWLEEINETIDLDSSAYTPAYFIVWKYVLQMQKLRTANQLKLIMARFRQVIKEMGKCFVQHRLDMSQRIDDRLQHELVETKRICELFETAIFEGRIVRHEILMIDDCFYLNAENVLYPDFRPPYPFPLLEPEEGLLVPTGRIKNLIVQLCTFCPERCISIAMLSNLLSNRAKRYPICELSSNADSIPRAMFGYTVNFIDWADFIINCFELPYVSVENLLNLKREYLKLEKNHEGTGDATDVHRYHEGMISKNAFDSVPLWFENTLPASPSIFLRYLNIKELIFLTFSIDGKLDYIAMLLAFCRDECSVIGLAKAVSVIMDTNVIPSQHDECPKNLIILPMETLFKTLVLCLRNYMVKKKTDLDDLVDSLRNIYCDLTKQNGNVFDALEVLRSDKLRILSEIGFRFTCRPLSAIVSLK